MEVALANLISRLMVISEKHAGVCDTEVRERLDDAVHHGFLIPTPRYRLPNDFACYSEDGNRQVKKALAEFLEFARAAASADGLTTFHLRLAAFQNLRVVAGLKGLVHLKVAAI